MPEPELLNAAQALVKDRGLLRLARRSRHIFGQLKQAVYKEVLDAVDQEKDMKIDMQDFLKVGNKL